MARRVLMILAHSAESSLCAALADAYAEGAQAAGDELRWLKLGELQFDPYLRQGYKQGQVLEHDLQVAQAAILWAEHLVWVYPVWWGSVPSVLKGFLDRAFLPGFAFKFKPGANFPDQLLKGRSAQLLVTMDTPPWYFRWIYRMPAIQQMRATTLEFCGIKPVKVACFGPVIHSTAAQRNRWLQRAKLLGQGKRCGEHSAWLRRLCS